MLDIEAWGLFGYFIIIFLSYSILPFPSDATIVLAGALYNPYMLFFLTLISSTLGSITTYYIGLKGIRRYVKKEVPKKEKTARKIFRKYGSISLLLFSWTPILGDPLILVAGTLKMNFRRFLIYTTIPKVAYFILLIWFGVGLEDIF